ncbi:hypothetical protein NC661_18145 [Aquibacillus koreensis]|uniref:DUF3600 domain-containing protein n=1 Tax=Aquibacillus koreensis TaxID=279446 RepID=A0A9X4ALB3_9BACI|nr:hypothetical protein [Aquibacillus koreensis]MCT2535440.1 hypothetical protein [Aquibacillus koreensis]MDC3422275.1 hypothetical protein [Aquibacillus koreensis]
MDKEQLNHYFEKMSPTESQKERMKEAVLSHGEKKGVRSNHVKRSRFPWLAHVAAGVVLALIIVGNLPFIVNTSAGIMNWFQDHIVNEIKELDELDKQDFEKDDLIHSEFSIEKHEKYKERFQIQGLSEERATEEAFHSQLNELAMINRAMDVGIQFSSEEALQKAQEVKEDHEKWLADEDKGENVLDEETLNSNKNELEAMSGDPFWDEYYRLYANAYNAMFEKLVEYERIENPTKDWNERNMEILIDFMSDEAEQINEFKREIGME